MVHLRATKAVLDRLKVPPREAMPARNALGDWFVGRFVWERKPLLMLMSRASRLCIVEEAREVRDLPGRLPIMVAHRLAMLGASLEQIDRELRTMDQVVVGRTDDRSALGAMNQFTQQAKWALYEIAADGGDLLDLQDSLGRTLTKAPDGGKDYIEPRAHAMELLAQAGIRG